MGVNKLIQAISVYNNTFAECRNFLLHILKSKEQVIKLEQQSVDVCIPYYIKYLEFKGINITEAIVYVNYSFPNTPFYQILIQTIVTCFNKLENNNLNFTPF